MERVQYGEIRDELKTGDVVIFSGRGKIPAVLKFFQRSRWSHVGLVVRVPQIDAVLLWESTILGRFDDVTTRLPAMGVRLVAMSERVAQYSGEVAVRRLGGVDLTEDDLARLDALRRELNGRPYERRALELLKSAWDGPLGHNEEDLSTVFCSELVAEAYQALGLLPEGQPSNEYTPADFSSERFLPLLRGAVLSDEIELV